MKINSVFVRRILREKKESPEKFAQKLGMTGEGFRKILKNESTTDATAEAIAHALGVHIDALKGEVEPVTFRQGTANDLYREIVAHERSITRLKNHIIKLYKIAGKELTQDEIDELNKA